MKNISKKVNHPIAIEFETIQHYLISPEDSERVTIMVPVHTTLHLCLKTLNWIACEDKIKKITLRVSLNC